MNDQRPAIDTDKLRELAKLRIVLDLPQTRDVTLLRNLPYQDGERGPLAMDVYRPAGNGSPSPAMLFVTGYADVALIDLVGFTIKDMACYVSWGQLAASAGIAGITYSSTSPLDDAPAALRYVREHSAELDIDPERIGIWAASGNGPTALALLASPGANLRYAVLNNTFTMDLDDDTTVASMAKTIGFAASAGLRSVEDLPADVPLFIVRSGRDEVPELNTALDRFVARAIETNRPLTLVNLPDAPHGFDIQHDTEASRETIRQILAFVRLNSGG